MLNRVRVAAVLSLVLGGALGARASSGEAGAIEPLLRRVPDDAQLVVVVRDLARLADGLTAFVKAAGIEAEGPITGRELVDGLGTATESLDLGGPFVFAMSATHGEPVVVARLAGAATQPTTRPARTIAGVNVLEFDDGLLARLDDGLALIARDEDTLRPALESRGELGQLLARDVVARFAGRQAMLYVDVAAWKERVDVVLNMVAQTSMMGLAAAGPEAAEAIHMQRWFFDQFRTLLGEARTYVAGITFSADAAAYDDRITVRTDGTLGKYLAAVRPSERDLFRGLAAGRAAAVFALEWTVPPDLRSIEDVLYESVIVTEERRERIGPERLKAGLERVKAASRRLSGYSGAMEWRPQSSTMAMTGVYLTDDPNAYIADFRTMFHETPELFEVWASLPGGCKVNHSTASIGGANIDQFKFTVSGSSPVEAAVGAIYGENPTLSLVSSRHGAAFYMGPADEAGPMLERMMSTDPKDTLAADPRVKAAVSHLDARPQLVLLLDMLRLVELSMEMSRAMGVPSVRVPRGADAAEFVAYGLYLLPDGARQQVYVPASSVRDVVRSFKHLADGSADSGN